MHLKRKRSVTKPSIKAYFKLTSNKKNSSESFVRNFNEKLFISCICIKRNYTYLKSISINSDLFNIIGVLNEHCVICISMGVSNMVSLGAAADSDKKVGFVGGNICDEVDEIFGDTSLSESVPTASSDTDQYEPAMFSGRINTGSGLASLTLGRSLTFANMTILEEFA